LRPVVVALAALVMLVAACSHTTRPKEATMMENNLAKTIEKIADRLTEQDTSVAALMQMLGDIKQKFTGSGYYLAPRDTRFEAVWLGIRTDKDVEYLTDVELTLYPQVQLTIAALDRAFGPHETVPINPDGRRYRIGYRFDEAGKAYTAAIYATLSGAPEDSNTRVEKVLIRRDSR
jgi:hypothetical protein